MLLHENNKENWRSCGSKLWSEILMWQKRVMETQHKSEGKKLLQLQMKFINIEVISSKLLLSFFSNHHMQKRNSQTLPGTVSECFKKSCLQRQQRNVPSFQPGRGHRRGRSGRWAWETVLTVSSHFCSQNTPDVFSEAFRNHSGALCVKTAPAYVVHLLPQCSLFLSASQRTER